MNVSINRRVIPESKPGYQKYYYRIHNGYFYTLKTKTGLEITGMYAKTLYKVKHYE